MIFKEDKHTGLKENPKSGTIINDIVAFLNTCNGKIYIGLKNNGTIIGIQNLDDAMIRIADMLSNEILPSAENLVSLIPLMNVIKVSSQSAKKETIYFSVKNMEETRLVVSKGWKQVQEGCLKRKSNSL